MLSQFLRSRTIKCQKYNYRKSSFKPPGGEGLIYFKCAKGRGFIEGGGGVGGGAY